MTPDELDRIYDDIEVQEERARTQYRTRLALHPHCSDPAHPGCAECQDEDDEV